MIILSIFAIEVEIAFCHKIIITIGRQQPRGRHEI
jgi:hypothetical protein